MEGFLFYTGLDSPSILTIHDLSLRHEFEKRLVIESRQGGNSGENSGLADAAGGKNPARVQGSKRIGEWLYRIGADS